MLNIFKIIELRIPNVSKQPVRHKQIFPRKPRPPHFWAQKIERVLKPILPKPFDINFPVHLKCRKPLEITESKEKEEYPYERILANEIKDEVLRSKMILIFHCNQITHHILRRSTVAFKKEGMTLISNSRQTVKMAVDGTKFSSIVGLYQSHTLLLCCPEVKIYSAYNLLKKMPVFVLLAGIIDDKFVSRKILDEYGKLSDLNSARTQIAHTLKLTVSHLAYNISIIREKEL